MDTMDTYYHSVKHPTRHLYGQYDCVHGYLADKKRGAVNKHKLNNCINVHYYTVHKVSILSIGRFVDKSVDRGGNRGKVNELSIPFFLGDHRNLHTIISGGAI